MFKTTGPGLFLLLSSLALYMFKLVSRLMDKNVKQFSIEEIFGMNWVTIIPMDFARQLLVSISRQQLSVVFLCIGATFVFIGLFQRHHS
jgi:hypothetical protein